MAIGAVLSPGPVTVAVVTQSPRVGWATGPLISLGHALMELLMAMFIVLGISTLLASSGMQTAIALLGGVLLMWMGGGYLLAAIKRKYRLPTAQEHSRVMNRWQIFSLGMLTTISSPFWYAWWITVAATYMLQAKSLGLMPVAAFYLGHISVDFIWNTLLATMIGGGRKLLTNKTYNLIMGACGIFLVYLGVQFLIMGIKGMAG
ncbi:MAG TPA: LysE family transporter [Anaerolineae bacterium]|nr:LysE family transporter [Anaerolineae bacterium]